MLDEADDLTCSVFSQRDRSAIAKLMSSWALNQPEAALHLLGLRPQAAELMSYHGWSGQEAEEAQQTAGDAAVAELTANAVYEAAPTSKAVKAAVQDAAAKAPAWRKAAEQKHRALLQQLRVVLHKVATAGAREQQATAAAAYKEAKQQLLAARFVVNLPDLIKETTAAAATAEVCKRPLFCGS